MSERKVYGELYLDDEGKPHFDCHIHSSVSFEDAEKALRGFRDLIQDQLDRRSECPLRRARTP